MNNQSIENIVNGLEPIALIIKADFQEDGLQFFTPDSFSQQVAYMKHPAGKRVVPHVHKLIPRQVLYTQEVLFIKKGKVQVNFFTSAREFLTSRILESGDVILLCGGGHSLIMLEESVMIEVKQGPYAGENDKITFEEVKE
jgi:mannose-6-phosphate isomerase-like protein (cupin superfamily)